MTTTRFSRALFLCALLFCLTPWASPGLALALGLVIALAFETPFPLLLKRWSKPLLQLSVVLLGFGMNLGAIAQAARHGFWLSALTIAVSFSLGALLRRLLKLPTSTSTLLSAGTAICGGSAIAAVALAIGAAQAEISVALGTVFLLNALALYLFPALGHLLALTPEQFGNWAGLAIHDISSVVGAASSYGTEALSTAMAVKLSRTLWIIPIALVAGLLTRRGGSARAPQVPWFIGLFLAASLLGSFVPELAPALPALRYCAKAGMAVTLLCIGAGLSAESLRRVGARPVLFGVILWLAIGSLSLVAIY